MANRAGMLCQSTVFQRFVGAQILGEGQQVTPTVAAEYLRQSCGIASRRDLNTDTVAANKFETLRTEFDAWRGKVGRPR